MVWTAACCPQSMRRFALVLVMTTFAAACATEDDGDWGPDWVDGKADGEQLLSYKRIASESQFRGMALANGGVVIQGPSLKFVIDRRDPAKPVVYFQNANYKQNGQTPMSARYHFYFSEAVLPDF